tara:strand:- start:3396 stop:3878 length:483 start_codon:yes stop_codon:yes gene_type:complete
MISQECIDFLKEVGADKKSHSTKLKGDGYTLLDHLIATHKVLEEAGSPEYLQNAGLFHSIYGTDMFMSGNGMLSFDERYKIKELIGEQSEEIVFWFCKIASPRHENIMKLEQGVEYLDPVTGEGYIFPSIRLRDDLMHLNANHEMLYQVPEMSWEEAYNL